MPVRITCPSCETAYTVPDAQRGKRLICRECKEAIVVPAAREPAAPHAEAVTERKPRAAAKAPPPAAEVGEEARPRKKPDGEGIRPHQPAARATRARTEDDA